MNQKNIEELKRLRIEIRKFELAEKTKKIKDMVNEAKHNYYERMRSLREKSPTEKALEYDAALKRTENAKEKEGRIGVDAQLQKMGISEGGPKAIPGWTPGEKKG